MTFTPELKQAVEKGADDLVRIEDPKTHTAYPIVREDMRRRMYALSAIDHSDRSLDEFGEFHPDRRRSSTACLSPTEPTSSRYEARGWTCTGTRSPAGSADRTEDDPR